MKKTLVIGLGISGRAAVHYLLSMGRQVVAIDRNPHQLLQLTSIDRCSYCLESDFDPLQEIEEVILSSGVRPNHPFAKIAPTVGEAELCLRRTSQRCIGITGTNGKTTVTSMVAHILNHAGIKARAVGNIGIPLAEYFLSPNSEEVLVVELSSYQLETLTSPIFEAAIILNISADHLDQYNDLEEYARAKCQLQKCMKEGSILTVLEQVKSEFGFLLYNEVKVASFLPFSYRHTSKHKHDNIRAAWEMVDPFGITPEQFMTALQTFKTPPHRIEFVAEIEGVFYFDDSKGTNVDAVIQAVSDMQGPTILIAGGVDKGSNYQPWNQSFREKIKKILLIGQAAVKIKNDLLPNYEVVLSSSLEEAVQMAAKEAVEGDCVLLSPGCASFDMFRDYAHRGEEFKRCVRNLRRKE